MKKDVIAYLKEVKKTLMCTGYHNGKMVHLAYKDAGWVFCKRANGIVAQEGTTQQFKSYAKGKKLCPTCQKIKKEEVKYFQKNKFN